MATKKSKMSKKKSSYKINKKKTIKILLPISMLAILVLILYTIINLIINPTEMFVIKNDTISTEESAIRICNKR